MVVVIIFIIIGLFVPVLSMLDIILRIRITLIAFLKQFVRPIFIENARPYKMFFFIHLLSYFVRLRRIRMFSLANIPLSVELLLHVPLTSSLSALIR